MSSTLPNMTCTMTAIPTVGKNDRIHRRLKSVLERPENQSCCDCGAPKPTWGFVIHPPPDVPQEELNIPMGALCCNDCSEVHQRLGVGVHISFIKNTTIVEWNDKDVTALEAGGNKRVNRTFEGRLSSRRASMEKPNATSDLVLREQFITSKYHDRKYFEPAKYQTAKARPSSKSDSAVLATTSGTSPEKKLSSSTTRTSNKVVAPLSPVSNFDEQMETDECQRTMETESFHGRVSEDSSLKSREDRGNKSEIKESETKEPEYFLPLKDGRAVEMETSTVHRDHDHDRDHSVSSRASTSSKSPDRVARLRRSSRSRDSTTHTNSSDDRRTSSSHTTTNSKSPKRSSSTSRRSHAKEHSTTSSSTRRSGTRNNMDKEEMVPTSRMQRRGSTSLIDTESCSRHQDFRENVDSSSAVGTSTRKSGRQNGSGNSIPKSSSDHSLTSRSKPNGIVHSKLGSFGALGNPGKNDSFPSQNATFQVLQPSENAGALDFLSSVQSKPNRLTSEYIMQELAKIQLSSNPTIINNRSLSTGSSHGNGSSSAKRSSHNKSPPRGAVAGRRQPSKKYTSDAEKGESEGSDSNPDGGSQGNDVVQEEHQEEAANIRGTPKLVASKFALAETKENPRTSSGLSRRELDSIQQGITKRVPSKSVLEEHDESTQQSYQKRSRSSNRRNGSRKSSSRSCSRSSSRDSCSQSSYSRSPSRERSTSSRQSMRSESESASNKNRLVRRSKSKDHSARKSESDTTLAGARRVMIRQNSGRELEADEKTINPTIPLSLPANSKKTSVDMTGTNNRPLSRRLLSGDDGEMVNHDPQQMSAAVSTGRSKSALRRRRDPLSSKSDHQIRSRGRMTARVDAANHKAVVGQSSLTQTAPIAPTSISFGTFHRTASMPRLVDNHHDNDNDSLGGRASSHGINPRSSRMDHPTSQDSLGGRASSHGMNPRSSRIDNPSKDLLGRSSSHGINPRSSLRGIDKNCLSSSSSHGINPRLTRSKTTGSKPSSVSGNDKIFQLFAAAAPNDDTSKSVNDDDGDHNDDDACGNNCVQPKRSRKKLSAAALKAMQELKELTGC